MIMPKVIILVPLGYFLGSLMDASAASFGIRNAPLGIDILYWVLGFLQNRNFRFELQKEHVIEFTQLAIAKAEGSEHMLNRVMTRDNIALAAVLRIRPGIQSGVSPSDPDQGMTPTSHMGP